jgi:hypothetical protein
VKGGDSLEKVIVFYVDLAERRAGEARQKADAAAVVAASAQIADLENDLVGSGRGRERGGREGWLLALGFLARNG